MSRASSSLSTAPRSGSSAGPSFGATWTNATVGSHRLTAIATDNEGATTLSGPVTITVNGITATITAPPNGSSYVAPAAYDVTAIVSTSSGVITTVEWYDGSAKLLTQTVPAPGTATVNAALNLTAVAAGTHVYTVKGFDSGGRSATSPPITIVVTPPPNPPTVTLTSPQANQFFSAPASFTISANASATASGATISKVDFYRDGSPIGTDTTSPYSTSVANLAEGSYSFTAVATDSFGTTASSVAVLVNVGLTVSVVDPSAGAVFIAPADIRLAANAVSGETISRVDFLVNGTTIGSALAQPFSVVWPSVTPGTYSVRARMTDAASHVITSVPINVVVVAAPTAATAPGLDGSSTSDQVISLNGTAVAPLNTAISVNGKAASVDASGNWVVNGVELVQGSNTISVRLSSIEGSFTGPSITINRSGSPAFDFSLNELEGFAPFSPKATLTALGTVPVGRVEFDFNGDGIPDLTVTNFNQSFTATLSISQPGAVQVGVKVYDTSNALVYSASRWAQALSPSTVGYRALSAFNGMIDKLTLGNASGALNFFMGNSRAIYQDVFSALGSNLPQVAQQLGSLKQGTFGLTIAEFVVVQQTSSGPISVPAYVYRGVDGVWRLESF
jgi:hypothetical protein